MIVCETGIMTDGYHSTRGISYIINKEITLNSLLYIIIRFYCTHFVKSISSRLNGNNR